MVLASVGWLGLTAAAQAQQYRGTPPYQPATLTEAVSKIAANDQRQDLRLYNLEKDVSGIQEAKNTRLPSYESGTSGLPMGESYTVRKGDTLWRIAMTNRVSPGEIMTLNGMANDQVIEGQTLLIPNRNATSSPPPSSSTKSSSSNPKTGIAGTHLVGPGDTFSQIAQRYRVSQQDLAGANPGVNPNLIQIGSYLVIPGSGAPSSAPPLKQPTSSVRAGGGTYTVRPGDHLGAIAKAHGVPTASLQQLNGLSDPNMLRIGQVIALPAGATAPTSTAALTSPSPAYVSSTPHSTPPPTYPASATSITSPAPAPAPSPPSTPSSSATPQAAHRGILSYRVDSTDSLESIADTFGTTPQRIRELNMLAPAQKIVAGQELLVPSMGAVGSR